MEITLWIMMILKPEFVLYIWSFLAKVSEHQPNSDEIHLIKQTKKIDVYYDMLEVWKTTYQLSELPSFDLFYQVWQTQFPHLKNPKNCRLGQCDVCADWQSNLQRLEARYINSF
jgi:hypothetical protein